MESKTGLRLTPQIVLGACVVTVGLLFALDNAGVLEAGEYLRFWPLGLVAIGLTTLARARGTPGRAGGLVWMLVGGGLLLDEIELVTFDFDDIFPLLLIAFGGYLVWRGFTARRATRSADDASSVAALAIMSGIERKNGAQDFRGGELTAIMGGCEVDLRQASIAGGEAVIETFALWGGISIQVPETWTIVSKVFPLMGGFEDSTRPPKGDSNQRLVVQGFAIMGGIEVKN